MKNSKVVIKKRSIDGAVISVQKNEWGVFWPSEDIELSRTELDGLSFLEIMDLVHDTKYSEDSVPRTFTLPFQMNKKNLMILIVGWLVMVTGAIVTYLIRPTVDRIEQQISQIRKSREKRYDSCVQSCLDDRIPLDKKVKQKQLELQILKSK